MYRSVPAACDAAWYCQDNGTFFINLQRVWLPSRMQTYPVQFERVVQNASRIRDVKIWSISEMKNCWLFCSVLHYLLFKWGTDFWRSFLIFRRGDYLCVSAFPPPCAVYALLFFWRSSSIAPTVRFSAGTPDGNEVLDRAGLLEDWIRCKFCLFFRKTVNCFCSVDDNSDFSRIRAGPLRSLQLPERFQDWSFRLTHVDTPYCWKCACGGRPKWLRLNLELIQSSLFLNLFERS